MKYLILGDLHFKKCSEYEISYRNKVLKFVSEYMMKNDIFNIIQLGDFFHDRRTLDVNLLYETKNLIKKYFSFVKNFNVILGNHDSYFNNTNEINSISLFKDNIDTNINVIDDIYIDKDNSFLYVPWINEENKERYIETIKNTDTNYCFGHFEINTFEMTKGIMATESLNKDTFKNYKRVFSGHYHLTQDKGNISYVGSLFQNDFGDYDDRKRFYIIDTDRNTVEEVKIPLIYFEKVTVNTEDELENLNIDSYKDLNTQFIFNIPTSVKREKIINEITENIINYNIIDNSKLCNEEIVIETEDNFNKLFTDYISNNNYDDNKRKSMTDLFNEAYLKVIKA